MPRIVLAKVGERNGLPLYSPMDKEDERVCGSQNTLVCDVKGDRSKRTTLQNKSIHKYWSLICDALNDAGWTKKKYFEVKEVDIDWTPESIGDDIWRGIQEAMYGHRNTSKLETHQVSKVYDNVSRHLSKTCCIDQSFPSRHG